MRRPFFDDLAFLTNLAIHAFTRSSFLYASFSRRTVQLCSEHIATVNGKLKWNDGLESLKYFVKKSLCYEGTWSSPVGHLKLFEEAVPEGVVIRYYSNSDSLLIQWDKGKEITNILVERLTSMSNETINCAKDIGNNEKEHIQPVEDGDLMLCNDVS